MATQEDYNRKKTEEYRRIYGKNPNFREMEQFDTNYSKINHITDVTRGLKSDFGFNGKKNEAS